MCRSSSVEIVHLNTFRGRRERERDTRETFSILLSSSVEISFVRNLTMLGTYLILHEIISFYSLVIFV